MRTVAFKFVEMEGLERCRQAEGWLKKLGKLTL